MASPTPGATALGRDRPARPAVLVAAILTTVLPSALLVAVSMVVTEPGPAGAQEPPFAAVQYGTNGCIEVGVRPDPPYNQPKPFIVPNGYDVLDGYPAFGYDPEPWDGTIRNAGYVRQVLANYWPAVPAPAVPSTSTKGSTSSGAAPSPWPSTSSPMCPPRRRPGWPRSATPSRTR